MNLNYNSVSSKIYRDFYNTQVMPESLCPYFWALLLAIPVSIILAPFHLPGRVISNKLVENSNFFIKSLCGIIAYILIFSILSIIVFILSAFTVFYKGSLLYDMYTIGLLWIFSLIVFIIVAVIFELVDRIKYARRFNKSTRNTESDNIIKEFIKAKYNKHCPKITWNE